MALSRSDILVRDREGQPIATVEVKNRDNLTVEIARALRRNLAVHGHLPSVRYFLLVSPDFGYLWKDVGPKDIEAQPTYQFTLQNVVTRYLSTSHQHRMSGEEFELVVFRWLVDLTLESPEPKHEPEKSLIASGFVAAISGGKVEAQVAV